jgi:hypothetical protein
MAGREEGGRNDPLYAYMNKRKKRKKEKINKIKK